MLLFMSKSTCSLVEIESSLASITISLIIFSFLPFLLYLPICWPSISSASKSSLFCFPLIHLYYPQLFYINICCRFFAIIFNIAIIFIPIFTRGVFIQINCWIIRINNNITFIFICWFCFRAFLFVLRIDIRCYYICSASILCPLNLLKSQPPDNLEDSFTQYVEFDNAQIKEICA